LWIFYEWLLAARPERRIRVLNRGISGNRTGDLIARWKDDCIDLKPDIVTILIGINDAWYAFKRDMPTSAETFEANYRTVLERTRNETHATIVMMEPFVLHVPEDRAGWRTDLDPKIHAVRRLALEFGAVLIPLDGIFAAACARREPEFWTPDGVHPSAAGHGLIAHAWLGAMGEL
jgi:lysophospholipase L1-like esterase